MIKILAIDMDGTCLNDGKVLTDRTLHALKSANEAGILVVPTTGRTATCLPGKLKSDPFYQYVISSNGAVVFDIHTKERIYEAEIPYEEVLGILEQAEHRHLGLSVHLDHHFLLEGLWLKALGLFFYRRDANSTVCVKNLRAVIRREKRNVEEIQLFYLSGAGERRARELLDNYPHLLCSYTRLYAEVFAAEASKGNGLHALGEYLGIPRENIACIGDGDNDLSMFEASGMKFAMGNGVRELKDQADIVLPDNNHDGVAEAIEKYILMP